MLPMAYVASLLPERNDFIPVLLFNTTSSHTDTNTDTHTYTRTHTFFLLYFSQWSCHWQKTDAQLSKHTCIGCRNQQGQLFHKRLHQARRKFMAQSERVVGERGGVLEGASASFFHGGLFSGVPGAFTVGPQLNTPRSSTQTMIFSFL